MFAEKPLKCKRYQERGVTRREGEESGKQEGAGPGEENSVVKAREDGRVAKCRGKKEQEERELHVQGDEEEN